MPDTYRSNPDHPSYDPFIKPPTHAPVPGRNDRKTIAQRIRATAALIAADRIPAVTQSNNGEADSAVRAKSDAAGYVAAHGTFTKGLAHDVHGRVRLGHLQALVAGLAQDPGNVEQMKESPFPGVYRGPNEGRAALFDVPLFDGKFVRPNSASMIARSWESPLAGHTYDLQGADADQVAMPPAPALGSAEATAEIAEVYGAALLRDVPFSGWRKADTDDGAKTADIAAKIGRLSFFSDDTLDSAAAKRRDARGTVSAETLFRGSTMGAKVGPYLSQFLLIGNAERPALDGAAKETPGSSVPDDALNRAGSFVPPELARAMSDGEGPKGPEDGFVRYGIQVIPQQFAGHLEGCDHMTEWQTWLDVQNGSNRKDAFDRYNDHARFIATPRDLATYVHFDQLYQSYLNACLIMLGANQPFDRGLPEGKGHPTRDGFATFGGPHILTLVTEVATRALKAVRRQKYNIHLRSRPEAVAAAISLAWRGGAAKASLGDQETKLDAMRADLGKAGILDAIRAHNANQNVFWGAQYENGVNLGPLTAETNALLPMAFPEGSPMHPSYGAGHATVAGACVTMLKAFFEMFEGDGMPGQIPIYDIVKKEGGHDGTYPEALFDKKRALTGKGAMLPHAFEPDPGEGHKTLRKAGDDRLTVEGELDKLAANIAIGRNFGGVHFYTDYYESIRMGERIAVSILQEQMLTYREPVSMRFTSFDGDRMMIVGTGGSRGSDDALTFVWDENGNGGTRKAFQDWWVRHA